jgi:CarboxypepD_reg-like domain
MISLSSPATIYPEGFHSLDEADRRCRPMLCIRNCAFFPILVLLSHLVLFAASAVAADVHGTVTNAQGGEPLGKIQAAIVGTGFIAATGADGTFHISQVPAGSYVLQVSGVGYRTLSIPFQLAAADDSKEFLLTLTPDNFRRTEQVEVRGDLFEAKDWPAVGDLTLTSSELQQTATVLANDPFRSLQSLPGISASANNDFFAQFSVMGTPYEQVGVYLDDVLVPNLLHTIASFPDAPTLSLFTGNDVEDLRLMPVAYPVRYADGSGAALTIHTRTGSEGHPLFHGSLGMADSEFLGEGGFCHAHKGTWLLDARKSYLGYLERLLANTRFSQDGFYDADLKLTYDITPTQTLSLLATGGQLRINDPNLPSTSDPNTLKTGSNNLAIARLGWRWTPTASHLVDAHVAFVRTSFEESNAATQLIDRSSDHEWSGGTNASWSWRRGMILQAGYSVRRPIENFADNFFSPAQPPVFFSSSASGVRQDAYLQHAAQFWNNRCRLEGGIRWDKLNNLRVEPITGQVSFTYQATRSTQLEAAWGKYAQLPDFVNDFGIGELIGTAPVVISALPRTSSQYVLAIEQRLGERSRLRVEGFDRENEQREDFFALFPPAPLKQSALSSRDYSRGLQFLLQRRSENRLSGWAGYTLVFARARSFEVPLQPLGIIGFNSLYFPTLSDQRHTVNLFGSYRFKPSVRFSAKALYGSGFPVDTFPPIRRLGPYERLDLRADKSWLFRQWKLSLYGELLNVTNHNNRRFAAFGFNPASGQTVLFTNDGIPVTPTAGLAFDF